MKLATFEHEGRQTYGVVTDGGVCDIRACWVGAPYSLLEAIEMGPPALEQMRHSAQACPDKLPLESVSLLAPIPRPPKVLGLAVNYAEHHREWDRGYDLPDNPRCMTTPRPFLMPATCVAGPGQTIPWPTFSEQIDYEVELAVVIGTRCSHVSPEEAGRHILGYTIANDVSARSCTHAEGRLKRPKDDFFDWLHGKWADGFFPMGPWIVTADEIGDEQNLDIELSVNGEVRQSASTSMMIHTVHQTVSFLSRLMTLTPGDIIATGTPAGVAMGSGKWLKGGDVMTCRIGKIGELTNTLGQRPAAFYKPCVRT